MENIERIEQYLSGELPSTERLNFEQELNANPNMKQELQDFLIAKEVIKSANIKKQVSQVHEEFMKERRKRPQEPDFEVIEPAKTKVIPFWQSLRGIAASVFILLGLSGIYGLGTTNSEDTAIGAMSNYQPLTVRGTVDDTVEIKNLFKAEQFDKVIQKIGVLQQPSTEVLLLKGIAELKTKQFDAAKLSFDKAQAQNSQRQENLFVHELSYYEIIAAAGSNRAAEALDLIEKLETDETNPYRDAFGWDTKLRLRILKMKQ